MWHIFKFFNYDLMANKRAKKYLRQVSKKRLMHLAHQAMQKSMQRVKAHYDGQKM
jgi:hypothetical protein